jgi:hypothetical protein
MKKRVTVIVSVLCLNACAHTGNNGIFYQYAQERKLAAAVQLQKEGKKAAAVEALTTLCAERGVPGITDEALFRLSLLTLKSSLENGRDTLQPAQQGLERLRKEYPASPWTGMAVPLTEMLAATADLRRQNRTLRNQNQSLSKENQELRENIEKLKRLDLELEKKAK